MKTKNYERRQFINHLLGGTFTLAVTPNLLAQNFTYSKDQIDWYDVKDLGVEGKGWKNTKSFLIDFRQRQRDLFEIKFGVYPETLQECLLDLFQILQIFMYDMSYHEKLSL